VALFNRRATGYLVGHDFHECVNLTLRPGPEIMTWVSQAAAAELALANPFVADQSHLRPSLINGLLETLRLNQSRGVPLDRLAETGRIFVEHNGAAFEYAATAFVVPEDRIRRWKPREPFDFYAARHHVAALASTAGVDLSREAAVALSGPSYGWQAGQSAGSGGHESGWLARFGLLNLALIRTLGIEGKVYAGIFAIRSERLPARAPRVRYSEPAAFPAALRDLALVVESGASAEEARGRVERSGRAAAAGAFELESVQVFDLYEGRGLPEGRKGLGFSLVFRSPTRTLTDDEVNGVLLRMQEEIARSTGYQIRK
jgi:phenylalanyl-tRNA synthetase beta chain